MHIILITSLGSCLYAGVPQSKWKGYWDIDSSVTAESNKPESLPRITPSLFKASFSVWIRIYQKVISVQDLPSCNFHPSCSNFALRAVRKFGPFKGWLLAGDRLLRCNPFVKNYYPLDYDFDGKKFQDPIVKYRFK